MMKLILPIKNTDYLDIFIENGADEFYGGYIDTKWEEAYGSYIEYNRRGNYGKRANFDSEKVFYETVSMCAKREKLFYLTLNALKITDEQRQILAQMLERFKNAGGYGVIFSDPVMLEDIQHYGLQPVVSSCAGVTNHYIADFYKKQGCTRIIFPRDITLGEMRRITEEIPDMEYEMFFMNSGCRFTDSNCLGLHGTKEKALCEYCDRYPIEFYGRNGKTIDEAAVSKLTKKQEEFRQLWSKTCACCNLYDVKDYIHSLKIVGRAASEEKLLNQLRLARKNVDFAKNCTSRREYLEYMERPENSQKLCKFYLNCYYRTDMIREEKQQQKLESAYAEFMGQFEPEGLKEKTEYVGANLSIKNGNLHVDYKLYFNTKASLEEHHPVVDSLKERGMLRAVTRIHDTVHGNCDRFDLGLAKRTKENMEYFLKVMSEHSTVMGEHLDEICLLNQMKISEKPEDAYAALYFFGFLEKEGNVEAIKTHFLTRFCADADRISINDRYEDAYYLQFLTETGIEPFEKMIPPIKTILEVSGGHLWMVGVDYFQKGRIKYKIYVKKRGPELYHALRLAIKDTGLLEKAVLVDSLESLEYWHGQHQELKVDGIAVGLDEQGKWTLNFYYLWE